MPEPFAFPQTCIYNEFCRVLVVDDDEMVCRVVIDTLAEWPQAEVDCASSGELAVRKLRDTHYDIALIDGRLPGISGLALAEFAANENTAVLLISGHPETNQIFESFGYPYLPKPFPLAQLLAVSKRVITEARINICRVQAAAARMKANGNCSRPLLKNRSG